MKPLILYHANCCDGFCAAWIACKALGPDCDFVPVQYGQEPPDVTGRDVYILDFSYKLGVTLRMAESAARLVVLDHHKTAEAELSGLKTMNPLVVFDMNKSGGRLVWEYFFKGIKTPSPWLVDYTEDRDLWRWKLPYSREINAAIRSYPLSFELWDSWDENRSVSGDRVPVLLSRFITEGEAIIRCEQQIIDDHLRHAREIEMDGHRILAVNATVLFSEIAGELAQAKCHRCEGDGKAHGADRPFEWHGDGTYPGPCPVCNGSGKRPFGACYFNRQDGKRQWSLRSRDGGVDVSEIAKRRGGGGHRNAAGFEEPCQVT